MELDVLIKMKINGLLKKNSIDNLYYSDFCEAIAKTKFSTEDIVKYLITKANAELEKEKPTNLLNKLMYSVFLIADCGAGDYIMFKKETAKEMNNLIINYLEKTDIESQEEMKKIIEDFQEFMQTFYISANDQTTEISDEQLKELEQELANTKKEIADLNLQLTDLSQKINKKNKEYEKLKQSEISLKQIKNKLEITIENLKKNQTIQRNQIQTYIQEIKENQKEIINLQNTVSELEISLATIEGQYNVEVLLSKEKDNLISNYSQKEKELALKEANLVQKQIEDNQIVELILTKLYLEYKIDIESIILELEKLGIKRNKQQIYNQLQLLRTKLKIKGPFFDTFPPTYQIDKSAPQYSEPFNYGVRDYQRCLDFLIKSDLHIKTTTNLEELTKKNDDLYNYCIKNNINMIFDLGDSFRIYSSEKNIENLKEIESLIDKYISATPKNTGIYQALLGGNHDEEVLKFGINPIEILSQSCEGFIDLGYAHRLITLGNPNNCLMFHHPHQRFNENGIINNRSNKDIQDYLNNFYNGRKKINREHVYCDMLGHTHKSKLDFFNSYCTVPSYSKDRIKNGCWHLKIYFDQNQNIDYIIFIPIIYENNLIATSEIVYQKLKKKNKLY